MSTEAKDKQSGKDVRGLQTVLLRGALGAVPIVGPLLAEVVGSLIPDQRIERLRAFAAHLEARISGLETEQLRQELQNPRKVDLLEDGLHHATRALSEERLEYIASVVAHGITDRLDAIQAKHLLSILRELNDIEVLILLSYDHNLSYDSAFWDKHGDVIRQPATTFSSSQEEHDQYFLHRSFRNHLMRLGLLRPRLKRLRPGEVPEFDQETGMIKTSGHEVTGLGNMLLRAVDLMRAN